MRMSRREFEELVAEALDELPQPFAQFMENVDVVVEDEPSPEDLRAAGLGPRATLYGLYQGIPQTGRGMHYTWVLPDKITIFMRPILRDCRDWNEVRDQVLETVIHEVAHHFGISDERLEELGWA